MATAVGHQLAPALPLEVNAAVRWVLEKLCSRCGAVPTAADLKLFQSLPVVYAALAVKNSGKTFETGNKYKEAVLTFERLAAPGFLRWLADVVEEEPSIVLPAWLNSVILHQTTLGGKHQSAPCPDDFCWW
jgi:hypothetical protein